MRWSAVRQAQVHFSARHPSEHTSNEIDKMCCNVIVNVPGIEKDKIRKGEIATKTLNIFVMSLVCLPLYMTTGTSWNFVASTGVRNLK